MLSSLSLRHLRLLVPLSALVMLACAHGATDPDDTFGPIPDASRPTPAVDAASPASPAATAVKDPASSGWTADPVDAATTNLGSGDDGAAGDDAAETSVDDDASDAPVATATAATSPVPGDLAITEIMLEPSGEEPETEWFEVYNTTATPKTLGGLVIEDGFFDTAVIGHGPEVVVAPFAYAVLARDRAAAIGALVPASSIVYAYGGGVPDDEGIELDADDYGDLSLWSGGTMLAEVPYGNWDAAFIGQSIELADPTTAEDDPSHWCIAQTPWARGSDDGTPGAPSDCGP
jgi:hypothetical protein